MVKILIQPGLAPRWPRVVILVVIILVVYHFAPGLAAPLAAGSWLGWLAVSPPAPGAPLALDRSA